MNRYKLIGLTASGISTAMVCGVVFAVCAWKAEAKKENAVSIESPAPALPGPVLAVLPMPDGKLYAGTARGVYRLEEGRRWKRVFAPGLLGRPVQAMGPLGAQGGLWAAAGPKLYLSPSDGEAWRPGFRADETILCLIEDPAEASRLLIGTEQGIYESPDGGRSARRIGEGVPAARFFNLLFHPRDAALCLAMSDRGLFRSEDGGKSWTRENELPSAGSSVEEPDSGEEPEFNGEEELPPTGLEPVPSLAADPSRGLLYASTGAEVFRGRAGGAWERLPSEGLTAPVEKMAISQDKEGSRLLAASSSGLYLYDEEQNRWRPVEDGRPRGKVNDLEAAVYQPGGAFCWVGTQEGIFRIPVPEKSEEAGADVLPREETLSAEPTIQQVQRVVAVYAEVGPEKVRNWRGLARLRAFIPSFTLGLDRDRGTNVVSATANGLTRFTVGPEDQSRSLDFGFTWDLGDLLFSSDQTSIDVRSRLTTQLRQDLLEEATRLYFERRRLLSEFQAQPAQDPVLNRERSLRIAELTAYLDALTGGWFSRQLE